MKYQSIPVHEILIHKHPLIFFSLVKDLLVDAAFWIKAFFLKQFFHLTLLTIISVILFHVSLFHVNYSLILASTNISFLCLLLDYPWCCFIYWAWYRSPHLCLVFRSSYCKASHYFYDLWLYSRNDSKPLGI